MPTTTITRGGLSVPAAIPAIELIDVHTMLGGEWVLRGVSFGVQADRITALLGPSGVGKTTCLRHITGLLVPDEGDVLIEGRSTLSMSRAKRLELSKRFGVLLQGSGLHGSALWESLTVEENLLQQLRLARTDWDEGEMIKRAGGWLSLVGLSSSAGLVPSQLSAGMRRRLALARALVADPQFAVLDSFELGLDPVRLAGVCELIAGRDRTGRGCHLIATQKMEVARRLADDIIVLWEGRVIEYGPAEAVLASDRPEVQQLISGSLSGPLAMAGDRRLARPGPSRAAPHQQQRFEIPMPLAAAGLLVALTASVLVLGDGRLVELATVVVAWVVVGLLTLRGHARRERE